MVPARLEVVWEELISNSCRFRDAGRPLKIRIDASQNADTLQVHFADNGSGWNPDFAETLFQPLQRSSSQKGGFGLGLAIARATVESVGGQIHAQLGAPGACFQVLIPVAPDVHHTESQS
jgi:signal transduction histidine kinase